ncbi:uncharacterized protein LOC106460351 [Limulus polyphemus]|uniref:Uncharacterized protein LOC106460351 n=1 Tax=Limulus polyphemus TaxID=6850 RepID=A0ABM1B5Z3_LIMPO|nr:uncharacterized protein LOC106460351 [Limulus polyphemus]
MTIVQRFQLISCLVFSFCWISKGYVIYDEDKRQDLIPILRLGRSYSTPVDKWNFFPRIGRSPVLSLLPFPYTPEYYSFKNYENADDFKRSLPSFTPRIGRKKRSILNEDSDDQQEWLDLSDYDNLGRGDVQLRSVFVPRIGRSPATEEIKDDTKRVAFTPRIGRAPFIPRIGRADPEIYRSSRTAFTPRIGRAPFIPRIGRSSNSADKETED